MRLRIGAEIRFRPKKHGDVKPFSARQFDAAFFAGHLGVIRPHHQDAGVAGTPGNFTPSTSPQSFQHLNRRSGHRASWFALQRDGMFYIWLFGSTIPFLL
jgi:hypothetical protein